MVSGVGRQWQACHHRGDGSEDGDESCVGDGGGIDAGGERRQRPGPGVAAWRGRRGVARPAFVAPAARPGEWLLLGLVHVQRRFHLDRELDLLAHHDPAAGDRHVGRDAVPRQLLRQGLCSSCVFA